MSSTIRRAVVGSKLRRVAAVALVTGLAVLSACGGGSKGTVATSGGSSHTFHGDAVIPPSPAPEPRLPDQFGKPYSIAQRNKDGRVVLLYFGYTHCPDFCPGTLAEFKQIKQVLGPKAAKVDFVMVAVDPVRDTPSAMKQYLSFFDPTFIGLTSDPASVQATIQSYGVEVTKNAPDAKGNYTVDHIVAVFIIDRHGMVRATYPYGAKPAGIADDVSYLLKNF